jgi:hypothetical protein
MRSPSLKIKNRKFTLILSQFFFLVKKGRPVPFDQKAPWLLFFCDKNVIFL